jgi:hypothetical protein
VVVNLAIENEPNAIRATSHRLVSGFRQIDDRQATKAKPAPIFVKEQLTSIVRPAMRHHVAHPLNQRALDIAARGSVFPNSTNAAHQLFSIADCRQPISR